MGYFILIASLHRCIRVYARVTCPPRSEPGTGVNGSRRHSNSKESSVPAAHMRGSKMALMLCCSARVVLSSFSKRVS